MMVPPEVLKFGNRDQWRHWLAKHHDTSTEARLLIFKKNFQGEGLSLADAVEEALCFGWIDGILHPFDEKRYIPRFSPRNNPSVWSINNIRRVEKLIRAGKMTAAGQSGSPRPWRMESGGGLPKGKYQGYPRGLEEVLRATGGPPRCL